jgi:hypothetical protein
VRTHFFGIFGSPAADGVETDFGVLVPGLLARAFTSVGLPVGCGQSKASWRLGGGVSSLRAHSASVSSSKRCLHLRGAIMSGEAGAEPSKTSGPAWSLQLESSAKGAASLGWMMRTHPSHLDLQHWRLCSSCSCQRASHTAV